MKLGKRAKRGLMLLGGILLLFVLAHTPPAKSAARWGAARLISSLTAGPASIARLDYRLWRGEFELTGVSLQPAPESGFVLVADRIRATVSPTLKLSADVQGLDLALLVSLDGPATSDTSALLAWVRRLRITDGAVRFQSGVDTGGLEEWLTVEGIEADLTEDGEEHRVVLHAARSLARMGSSEAAFGALDADLFLGADSLRVVAASLFKDDSYVRAEGVLDLADGPTGELDVQYALDGSLARLIDDEFTVTGVASGSARAAFAAGEVTIDAEASSDVIEWEAVVARDVEATIRYEDEALHIENLAATGFGGEARLSGDIQLGELGAQRLELTFSGLDVVDAARQIAGETLPFSSRVSGDARLAWTGWQLEDASGDARIQLEPGADLSGNISAVLQQGRVWLQTDDLAVPSWSSSLSARADVDPLSGEFEAEYQLEVADLAGVPFESPIPVAGSLEAAGRAAGTFDAPTWTARVASDSLGLSGESFALSGELEGSTESAVLRDVRLEGAGGVLSMQGSVPLEAGQPWAVTATVEGLEVSMAMIEGFGLDVAELPLEATVDADIDIGGRFEDPDWTVELRLPSLMAFGAPGAASASVAKLGRDVHLRDVRASYGGGSLEGRGSYGLDSGAIDGDLFIRGLQLAELPLPDQFAEDLAGVVQLEATFAGTLESPEGHARLAAGDLFYNDVAVPGVELELTAQGGKALIEGVSESGPTFIVGEVQLEGDYPLSAEIQLGALPFSEWMSSLTAGWSRDQDEWDMHGTARVDVSLGGLESLTYEASVESVEARFPERTVRAAPFRLLGDAQRLRVEGVEATGAGTRFALDATIPLVDGEAIDLVAAGQLDLAALDLLDPELSMTGLADLDLTVSGLISDPRAEGVLRIRGARGSYGDLAWTELDLSLDADNDRLRNVSMSTVVLDGTIALAGELPLPGASPGGFLELDVRGIDLTYLLPPESQTPDLSVRTSVEGRIEIPALELAGISGDGEIISVVVNAGDLSVEAARAAAWRLGDGELSVPELRLEGTGTTLELELAYLRLAGGLDFRGQASGRIDTQLLNPLLARHRMQVRGEATLDVSVAAEQGSISLNGGGSVRGGRFTSFRPQFSLAEAVADFELSETTLDVTRLEARAGAGQLRGSAHVDWSDFERPLVDLRLDADSVPLEIMAGFRAEVSGELRLGNEAGPARLSGSLLLDRGVMTREFDDDERALSSQGIALRDPNDTPGLLSGLGLDLTVATARSIHVENSTARLEVAGSLSVRGTVGVPEAGGILTVVPDGTFDIGRNRLQIISGRVDLTGFPSEQPYLDVEAFTRVGTTTINVAVEGHADDLRTRLTAPEEPELTEGDLASLLVTGRTLENAGAGGAQVASAWAMSSLADLVHDGLGDLITFGPPPGAGPMILAEEADPTARLSFGFPVTERLSVTYSIGLDSTERRLFILDYRVARNIWLRAIQENSSDYAFGISQRFEFNLLRRPPREGTTRRGDQRVGSVSMEGMPPTLTLGPRISDGDRFDYWAVRDDATRLRQELVEAGYASALIDVDTTAEEGESVDTVSVHFDVDPGVPSAFVWRGDDPGRGIRSEIEQSWDGRIPEEFQLTAATVSVRTRLRAQRYFTAEVATAIERRDGDNGALRNIVFDVTRGPRGRSVVLSFDGNDALPDEELVAALPATDTAEFFALLEQPSELERGLRLRYAAEGYLDAASATPRTRVDEETGRLYVEVPVDEGQVTRVDRVDFGDSLSLDRGRVDDSFGVRPGGPVDFGEIRAGQARVRALYRSEGFSDVRVRADLARTEGGLDVALLIEEGPRALVGEVRVVGNTRTLPRVILNELTFRSGDPIRLTDFQNTQKRLYDLAIFRSADVRPDPAQQGREIQDVVIRVVERSDVDVAYGARYNFVNSEQSVGKESEPRTSGLELNARINFLNPFRRGTNLGFSIFYQGNHQLLRGTFRMPTVFGRRIITEFIVDTEREKYVVGEGLPVLETTGGGFTFQQTRKLTDNRTDKFALQWNFRYAHFVADRFTEEGDLRTVDTYRPRFGVSLIEDRRDSFANPTRGRFWNVTVQAVPEIWGSDVGYVRFYGQAFFYYPITPSVVWASGYRVGVSSGTEEFLLMEDRFQAGGANSVRGYRQNTLGPAVFVAGPDIDEGFFYIGGQSVAVFNQELRFPIWKILHGGLFWDAGNVWGTYGGFSLTDLKHSVGAGVRVVLPFGALRFDFAEPLNPCSREALGMRPFSDCAAEIVRFHFSFGYAF